jgi:hypothetical protein
MSEVTPIRPDVPLSDPMQADRAFSKLLDDLNMVQSTLACACVALGQAQDVDASDESDVMECRDLGAKAWRVIYRCVDDLNQVHDAFDRWHVDQVRESARARRLGAQGDS